MLYTFSPYYLFSYFSKILWTFIFPLLLLALLFIYLFIYYYYYYCYYTYYYYYHHHFLKLFIYYEIQENNTKYIPQLARLLVLNVKIRKEQIILTRCQIDHDRFTDSYLVNNEERLKCIPCNSNYSLKHVLIDCVDVIDVHQTFYNVNIMSDLFSNVTGDTILKLKTIICSTIIRQHTFQMYCFLL